MKQPEVSFDEKIQASAVQFLIDRQNQEAAFILLSCTLELRDYSDDRYIANYNAILRGPLAAYEIINDEKHPVTKAIEDAFQAVLPIDCYIQNLIAKANLIDVAPDWKAQMLDIALGKEVHNQGISIDNRATIVWQHLRFRSQSEKKIAEALDRAGVFFLPNCRGRLNTPEGRDKKEADFIVCDNGKWGILEVDGEPYHPPSRTTQDHKRDRDFQAHGILIIQHFDANECYNQPDSVVRQFLKILRMQ
jgi:very-short-patch-repair endonuclease